MTIFISFQDCKGQGFYKYLTDKNNLELIAFTADLLIIFQRFHKNIQSKNSTIISLYDSVNNVKCELQKLKSVKLLSGWENALEKQIIISNEKFYLKNIEITEKNSRQSNSHNIRSLDAIKNEIILSLVEFLTQRFDPDDNLITAVKSLLKFDGLYS